MSLGLLWSGIRQSRRSGIQRTFLLLFLAGLFGTTGFAWRSSWLRGPCDQETNYYCIRVLKWEEGSSRVRLMILDNVSHSQNFLETPQALAFSYEQVFAELSAYLAAQVGHPGTLFLGGGGYTFPRYMQAVYPGSRLDVVEIDPGVTQVAYKEMGVVPGAGLTTYNDDARMFLMRNPASRYDLIIEDAFNSYSVPYHLVTKEYNQQVRAWLADGGIFMANLIDSSQRDFLRAYVATLSLTFSNVYVVPTAEPWREMPHNNYVVVATDQPLDLQAFEQIDGGDGETLFFNQVLSSEETEAILAEGRSLILTDQYAPVDQLLASFFRGFTAGQ
jgi:spermidine synthase